MPKARVVVVGSSNTDMIIQLERIPRPGETILGGEFVTAPGGKGANQAVGAARAGGQVALVARVGQDMFGTQAVAGFERDGIDVRHVSRDPLAPSGVALIFVGSDGENSIAVASGANARLSRQDVAAAHDVFQPPGILLTQLETPLDTVRSAIDQAAQTGMRIILNPAPAQPLIRPLLAGVTLLTPNETEAELLTGIKVGSESEARTAATRLRDLGVHAVIITLGARGAFLSAPGLEQLVPGFQVQPVDTTAAGDVFNGALAVAVGEGLELPQAVRFANAAAALSVTKRGAQPSAPTRAEIEQMLNA